MRRIFNCRPFRVLVCFCLICCFLVNCSPIRAKATVVGATVVTGTAAAGIFATMFAMAMGVVFVDLTADMITGLGQHFTTFISEHYSDDTETTNTTLTPWFEGLEYSFGGSGDDGTGNGDDNKITLIPDAIIGGLFAWIYQMIKEGGFDAPSAEAPEGYAYYNGVLLPDFPYSSYHWILYDSPTYGLEIIGANMKPAFRSFISGTIWPETGVKGYYLVDGLWVQSGSYTSNDTFYISDVLWTNYDICYKFTSEVVLAGMDPTSYATVFTEPNLYVGDIPQQIQDETYDEDDLKLPYINYGNVFGDSSSYVDALNKVATQLNDGTMTYDQYMDQIQTEAEGGSGDNSGSGDGTGEDSGGDSGGASGPVDSMLPYALDLTNFFPFCIPFDLYDFYQTLAAPPETPVFNLNIAGYTVVVDLSPWDEFAAYFRKFQLLLFVLGLAASSRKFIKW